MVQEGVLNVMSVSARYVCHSVHDKHGFITVLVDGKPCTLYVPAQYIFGPFTLGDDVILDVKLTFSDKSINARIVGVRKES